MSKGSTWLEWLRFLLGVLTVAVLLITGSSLLFPSEPAGPAEPGWSVEMPVVIRPWTPPETPR
ncbi:hypothetical protein [Nocardia asteroides]|uniref:hypothetical protein n=1 Tax=Nocardia asteroides TaxID=1824 RepID=UPI001E55B883|nr:hypothetical protein [Nocardia asteroides]UGT61888.1 hypothetical protein LTT61_00585 [Nocardia asteroides]